MKGNTRRLEREGDPCPRCGRKTQIREHKKITARELRQPFYYSRWFKCLNHNCRTTLIMPERFRVYPVDREPELLIPPPIPQFDDVVLSVLDADRPPWE